MRRAGFNGHDSVSWCYRLGIKGLAEMSGVFCELDADRVLFEDPLVVVIADGYPG